MIANFMPFFQNVEFNYDRNHTNLGRGFAYVEYTTSEEAETAMKNMDGGQIDGQVKQAFNWLNN